MTQTHLIRRIIAFTFVLASVFAAASSPTAHAGKGENAAKSTGPDSVVVLIGNRMFPDFGEIVTTRLHQRQPVGDTDFSFEVVSFYPYFAIIDSTKTVVSVSAEPKNPAFRIKVYKEGALADSAWAFYNMDVPHFSRTSALWFRIMQFDYRGEVFKKEVPKQPEPTTKDRKK